MTAFDYAVLLIIGFSVLVSVMRGAVREILALASWIAAFWAASIYTPWLAGELPEAVPGEALPLLAAFVILFLGMLLLMSLLTIALSELVKKIGLSTLDRGMGAVFGLARGGVIVIVLVLLAGLTGLPRQSFWRDAMFSAPLEAATLKVTAWLPEGLARRISYN